MVSDKTIQAFRKAYVRDEYLTVVRLGEYVCKALPREAWAWVMYGSALSATGRPKEAANTLRKAIRIAPPRGKRVALTELGAHYERVMQPGRAKRQYELAIEDSPAHTAGYIYLGALELALGNIQSAMELFRQATRCKEGALDEAWYNLAGALACGGTIREAHKAASRAIQLDPSYAAAKKLIKQLERANTA